ncbi:substrate-binding domain-containing protein [Nocardia sp. NPDC051570]|uniref:sugar ABC transporter substrate-binding protein n=1 Tax=Nocardia sp. NPDC051570 TaxID=3364324 RepID=UPI0037AAE693
MDVRFRRALVPLVLVGALAAAACGRGGTGDAGQFRIAIVTRNFTNPYWAALRDGALAEGAARGVKVVVQAGQSETDADGENAQISTMAAQGYDCFGVVPVNATNVITPLAAVARKNIPILNLDTQIDAKASQQAGVSYASFIGSDNLEAGRTAGRTMLEALGGSGKVVVLEGIAGEQNGINRNQGFSETVAGKLDIAQRAPADYEQDKGLQVTEAILEAHPDITGIFAANDTMGLGAAQAIKNAGRTGQIKVISVDGIRAALDAVQAGTLYGTVTQYPYAEGQLAVQGCLALHQGRKLPERVVAPIAFIGSGNVAAQLSAFPRPIVTFDNPVEGLLNK